MDETKQVPTDVLPSKTKTSLSLSLSHTHTHRVSSCLPPPPPSCVVFLLVLTCLAVAHDRMPLHLCFHLLKLFSCVADITPSQFDQHFILGILVYSVRFFINYLSNYTVYLFHSQYFYWHLSCLVSLFILPWPLFAFFLIYFDIFQCHIQWLIFINISFCSVMVLHCMLSVCRVARTEWMIRSKPSHLILGNKLTLSLSLSHTHTHTHTCMYTHLTFSQTGVLYFTCHIHHYVGC